MTIDTDIIKQIILEEFYLEVNAAHRADGRFAKKGQGKVYSLTKNAEDDVGPDSELEVPARGNITSQGKISSRYGMNTGDPDKNCGRLTIDGNKKKKTRSCKNYPKDYWDEGQELEDSYSAPKTEKQSTPGRKRQKKETEKRNRHKNKLDLVPRSVDSPSVRQDKLFGDAALYSLARGVMEDMENEEESFPRWTQSGKLVTKQDELDEAVLEPADEIYIKELIKQNVAQAIRQTQAQAKKQGVGCTWKNLMTAIQDIETAQKGHKDPK